MKDSIMFKSTLTTLLVSTFFVGCMSAAQHGQALQSSADRDLTVGTVQAKISKCMSQGDVATALGSPNIVAKDEGGTDTWIYDKIATEASYSNDSGGVGGFAGAGGTPGDTLILGGLFGNYNKNAGASSLTQKTLTVVIKFDTKNRVSDFNYHSSKF
jgi:outer membrane protein assembly factor BamE (lipoprotein component of BamABCDE complex)